MAFELRRAKFYDEKGDPHGKQKFNKNDKTFQYANGAYNVDYINSTCDIDYPLIFPFLARRKTFYYNIANSNPLILNKKAEPVMSPTLYNINLETKVAQVLNDLVNKGKWDIFKDPKVIMGILALGALIYYIASGGKLV